MSDNVTQCRLGNENLNRLLHSVGICQGMPKELDTVPMRHPVPIGQIGIRFACC